MTDQRTYEWDVFISHASEDKKTVVLALAAALQARGLRVWYDEWVLTIGDSLLEKIDAGLRKSAFGVVVLSRSFFGKKMWPKAELDGLMQKEVGGQKVILPVWHGLTIEDVRGHSLILAGRLAGTTEEGLDSLADKLVRAMGIGTPRSPGATTVAPSQSRYGTLVLAGIALETDPGPYAGPQLTKRQSIHRGLGGSTTVQDFGVSFSDEPVRVRSGQSKVDKATINQLSDLYRASGKAYPVSDWLGNEYSTYIAQFKPTSRDGTWWEYEMELIVLELRMLHGSPYSAGK
jgi:hypothetical protein